MSEALNLSCTVNAPCLPVSGSQRLVYLLLEVGGEVETGSLPVNLALVVDVSESMYFYLVSEAQFNELARQGVLKEVLVDGVPAWKPSGVSHDEMARRMPRKIDRVKDAVVTVLQQLGRDDRFSVIAFAEEALTLVPLTVGSEKRRALHAVDGLDALQLGDDTYIGRGMALGLDELQRAGWKDFVTRLLVLTDGFTRDQAVCREEAARARQAHIPISTLGLGGDFNEELMIPIADQTGGEAYLLDDLDRVSDVFARELQRVRAVRYRDLEIKLRPSQGVELRSAYRVHPSIAPLHAVDEGGSYSFSLGDLVGGENPALLLELLVPPRDGGVYRLAQALLAYDDPAGGTLGVKTRADVVVEYTPDVARAAQHVGRVMDVVEALSAYKLQRRAHADLEAGDVAGATHKLRAAVTRLLDMGEESLAAEVEQQAAEIEQQGQADGRRTKKLRYETRRLTQKLM